MNERLWIGVVSVVPLVLGGLVPALLWLAHRHRSKAKQSDTQVLGLKKQLTAAQKYELLGAMVAGLVHDMNNIHMATMGNLDLALMYGGLQDRSRNVLETARAATEKGVEVMHGVLSFSRGDERVQRMDLCFALQSMEGILGLLLRKGIKLSIRTPSYPIFLEMNKSALFQVIMNLVVNGRDALGENKGMIVVSADNHPDKIVIKVSDTGCGIPPHVLEHIFDWQFTTKAEGKGTGLGLSIVRDAVKRMGGTIAVATEVGKGTTFIIEVPAS